MRRACVCLLRRLPVAKFGRQKVAVTHLCTFDHRFRMAEPGRTVMGGRIAGSGRHGEGVFGVCFEGDLS